jgi:hypothetical protein
MNLQEAKDRVRIPDLWREFGYDGEPRKTCFCPFHENTKTRAFSVFDDGRAWKCHAGCGKGSVVDFVAKGMGLSDAEACQEILRRAGGVPQTPHFPREEKHAETAEREKARKRESWPVFETPTGAEIKAIAELRGLSKEGVSLAAERGLLYCANSREGRAYIITDLRRKNAQGRLLSGEHWSPGAKAKTLPGGSAAWPVGLREASSFPSIALVEGGPDFLAAFHLAFCAGVEDRVGPVAMLGASNAIPDDALRYFAAKRVRIFQHDDETGRIAAALWAAQSIAAGAEVDGYSFLGLRRADGGGVKDLNDFAQVHPDEWEEQREIIEAAFYFSLEGPLRGSGGVDDREKYRAVQKAA